MGDARAQKTKRNGLKTQADVLADREEIDTYPIKQTINLQNYISSHMVITMVAKCEDVQTLHGLLETKLHADLGVPYVKEVIKKQAIKYHGKLQWHPNEIVNPLKEQPRSRRLKKKWPKDLSAA
ncbi:hypothetical protein ILUMI_15625 [Ignelater luminosus]|uniref:Uncharacterized protein n=1 Tax=Ignelater luminosus TaxID=2038154 RepID=A0A8K0G8Y0_IGNLU|nr:hypothetical protein ILUMI_15625 [Ignelater luminosus]